MEKVAVNSGTMESDGVSVKLTPRCYQRELSIKASEGNIIICLETGCGKTLIAAMLLKQLSFQLSSKPHVAVFLVPKVILVEQQACAIRDFTGLKVGEYSGQSDSLRYDPEKWISDVCAFEVLVMTPQILLNVLQHAMLTFDCIKALVFDECHHCQKKHPYALIMEEFYFRAEISKRPRILGLTASPVIRKGKSESQCIEDISSLERMLDSKIVTVEDYSEIESIIPLPNIQVKEYSGVYNSLESLQLVMRTITTVKKKALCCMVNESIAIKKKAQERLERICRDLEYCIYELGPWCTRLAVSADFHIYKESTEWEPDKSSKVETDSFLRSVYEFLNQTFLQGSNGRDLNVNNLKPDLVSSKVLSLLDVLVTFRRPDMKCLVFVERVVAAKVLAQFLSEALKPLQCKHIVGTHSKAGGASRKHISDIIQEFRSGVVDLLVVTDVAEEGLDIQDCCLIVKFDIPKTLRSYIQSRGRARVKDSLYIILKDRMDISQEEQLSGLFRGETFVAQTISAGNKLCTDTKSSHPVVQCYEVKITGAIVDMHSSVQLLNRYCSTLPRDEFFCPQLSFFYIKEQAEVKCFIELPSNACIRLVEGEFCETEVAAKRAACLKACKILHLKGALNDHLLPNTGYKGQSALTLLNQKDSNVEREWLQEPVVPGIWSGKPSSASDLICLHMYKIDFSAVQKDREYTPFALVMKSPLPPKAAIFEKQCYLRGGKAVFCNLEPVIKNVFLDPLQVAQAEQFQRRLFSILLGGSLDHSQSKEEALADSPWYLLVPLKKHQQSNPIQDLKIDWERIIHLKPFGGSENIANVTMNNSLAVKDTVMQFSNSTVSTKNMPGLLVRTDHSSTLYIVIGIFEDLNAESPFPSIRYRSYVDYYNSKYSYKLNLKEQRLVKARFLRKVGNYGLDRSARGGGRNEHHTEHAQEPQESRNEPVRSIVELPAEICRIEYLGFYDDLVNAAVLLPTLMHQIEGILVATQFREFLSCQFPEGSLISVEKVLEAITTQRCLESFSMERLEFLGDSFLKYAISCNLFLAHEEANEGFLSHKRNEAVCNSMLANLGKKIGLVKYIRDAVFDPKDWAVPCNQSKVFCDENNIWDLHGEPSIASEGKTFVACNKRHRWIQLKTVADSVEALIGAYLEDGDEHSALAFMKFLGLKVDMDSIQIDKVQTLSQNILPLMNIDVKVIEEAISHTFEHKGLLVEALTHGSFSSPLVASYQRLEFLGDAVLNFLITQHLFREFIEANPGELSDLRCSIISNETFARITVEKKFYLHLIENSAKLLDCIKAFILNTNNSVQHEITGAWQGEKPPKVLGDILESLGGAILVDSRFDLRLVRKVFLPIFQPLISYGIIQMPPERELTELCQRRQLTWDEILEKNDEYVKFSFRIYIDHEVHGVGKSKDKKSAKRQAAVDALSKLRDLGYVHAIKRKAAMPQKTPKLELISSKKTPAQAERDEISRNSDGNSGQNTLQPHFEERQEMVNTDPLQDLLSAFCSTALNLNAPSYDWTYAATQGNVNNDQRASKAEQIMEFDFQQPNSRFVNDFTSHYVGPSNDFTSHYVGPSNEISRNNDDGNYQNTLQPYFDESQKRDDTCSSHNLLDVSCGTALNLTASGPNWTCKSTPEVVKSDHHVSDAEKIMESDIPDLNSNFVNDFASPHLPPPHGPNNWEKGRPRAKLHEACARNKWKYASFICSEERGPPHDKCYTYEVVLQLPRIGEVHCTGDSMKTVKQAMDSAAEELLNWLASSGYL